jgi:hypothetical protein
MTTESTIVNVGSNDVTTISVSSNESTILVAAAATVNIPTAVNLSDDTPLELANVGSSGVSLLAARADHVHPSTGASFNGGNF